MRPEINGKICLTKVDVWWVRQRRSDMITSSRCVTFDFVVHKFLACRGMSLAEFSSDVITVYINPSIVVAHFVSDRCVKPRDFHFSTVYKSTG